MANTTGDKTIRDFGAQHQSFTRIEGYFSSPEILADVVGPLMDISEFKDKDVLDLGSGPGRWLRVFHALGARTITAVEPSPAIEVSKQNTADLDNVTYHNVTGDKLPDGPYDFVYSYGVVHHIPEPDPVMKRAHAVLRPGGKAVIWLYGREGNGLYLAFAHTLRLITVRIPHKALGAVSAALVPLVRAYSWLSRHLPLPLRGYMRGYIDKVDNYRVKAVIFDQLNPHHAMYYRRDEAIDLLARAGFEDVRVYHRDGYSWTVIGTKAAAPPS